MKILIIEKQGTDSHYTTVLDDRFKETWEQGCKNNGVDEYIVETIVDQDVFGWVEQQNRFDDTVQRTFILLEK